MIVSGVTRRGSGPSSFPGAASGSADPVVPRRPSLSWSEK